MFLLLISGTPLRARKKSRVRRSTSDDLQIVIPGNEGLRLEALASVIGDREEDIVHTFIQWLGEQEKIESIQSLDHLKESLRLVPE